MYCSVLETGDRLGLAEEVVEVSHSTISGAFAVKRIETVAVHSTIDAAKW